MSKHLIPLAAAVAALALTSCESELASAVDQDRIHTVYELFYDANEDVTKARATFFFGSETGTRLELDGDAGVSFEGEDLNWQQALAYYEVELAGFRESGSFRFVNTEGAAFANAVAITPTDFPAEPADVPRDASYELAWDGPALGEDQTVSLTLLTEEVAGNDRLFWANDAGMDKILLPRDDLEKLTVGDATLVLDRFEDGELIEATSAGGKTIGHYRARNAEVQILD